VLQVFAWWTGVGLGKLGGKALRWESGKATTGPRAYTSLARKDVLINCNFPLATLLVLVTSMKSHEHTHSHTRTLRNQQDERTSRMLAKFQPTWSAVVGTQLISAKLGEWVSESGSGPKRNLPGRGAFQLRPSSCAC